MKIVITGGHHNSAFPVVEELKKRDSDTVVYWFGHRHTIKGNKNDSLEYMEITKLGIQFFELKAGKFYKTFNLVRLLKIPYGFFQAVFLLLKLKPDKILSFGGYLAVPTVLAGWLLGIPSYTHEQTVTVGWGNKFVSKFVKKVFISWPSSANQLRNKQKSSMSNQLKIVETGLPLRKEIFLLNSNSFQFNNDLPVLYLTAGKTGSHIINKNIIDCLEQILKVCNVIHQIGDNTVYDDYSNLEQIYSQIRNNVKGIYYPRKFVLFDEIGEVFQKADFLLIRGGAHTTYEALALKKPSIIIPIPWVSHNEQLKNAQVVADSGLGVVLEEKNLNPQSLYLAIKKMTENHTSYTLKNTQLANLINKDSAKIIVDEILNK